MLSRLALVTFLGALCACDAPPRAPEPAPPKVEEKAAAVPPSKEQLVALSGKCDKAASEQFRREWKGNADIAIHYNAKLNACFYVVTVASSGTLRKTLVDADGGVLYGEFLGPAVADSPAAERPKNCRIESFYCGSAREWDVLVEPYMQD